jgi:hypothetical protein
MFVYSETPLLSVVPTVFLRLSPSVSRGVSASFGRYTTESRYVVTRHYLLFVNTYVCTESEDTKPHRLGCWPLHSAATAYLGGQHLLRNRAINAFGTMFKTPIKYVLP